MSQNWGSKHVGPCYTINVNKVYICQTINIWLSLLVWVLKDLNQDNINVFQFCYFDAKYILCLSFLGITKNKLYSTS
jgi:hypothetical protein